MYDQETGLYYLQSRYYNPDWGRFINADALVSTGQGLLGNNMFAYCNNNPANCYDPSGMATFWTSTGDVNPLLSGYYGFGGGGGGYRVIPKKTAYDRRSGLVVNQSSFNHSGEPVGLGTFAANGCAVIATYNAVQLLGGFESLGGIRDEYLHEHGSILYGLGGVGPWSFDNYFAKHGYSYTGYFSFSALNKNVSEGDVIVFTLMNNANDITAGFHTMTAQYTGGIYQVYNAYSNCYSSSPMLDLRSVYKNSAWVYGYIVGG